MRQFVGIDLGQEPAPDETTVCKFRHLLEEHGLGEARLTSTFLICWTGTGTMEEFTIGGDERSLTGAWNGVDALTGSEDVVRMRKVERERVSNINVGAP
jgi:hypothetical protein